MSFLSIDQREAALSQMDAYLALIVADIDEQTRRLMDSMNLLQAQRDFRKQVRKACAGELDADELVTVDNVCRERLIYGIPHNPVEITSGQKVTVRGVWP